MYTAQSFWSLRYANQKQVFKVRPSETSANDYSTRHNIPQDNILIYSTYNVTARSLSLLYSIAIGYSFVGSKSGRDVTLIAHLQLVPKQKLRLLIQSVQLKSGPYLVFTKIYNMLYYTTNLNLQ